MFGTLILGLVAGVAAPYSEPNIKRMLESATMAETSLTGPELRGLALTTCLLVAALVASILSGGGGAVSLMVGAVLGVFGPRVIARFRSGNE